jgi:hypothetical protein
MRPVTGRDPGIADPGDVGARQIADLGVHIGAHDQHIEAGGAGEQRVRPGVRPVVDKVARPDLEGLATLPAQAGAVEHVHELLFDCVPMSRGGPLARVDAHAPEPRLRRCGAYTKVDPLGAQRPHVGPAPRAVVPVRDTVYGHDRSFFAQRSGGGLGAAPGCSQNRQWIALPYRPPQADVSLAAYAVAAHRSEAQRATAFLSPYADVWRGDGP